MMWIIDNSCDILLPVQARMIGAALIYLQANPPLAVRQAIDNCMRAFNS